jgi:prepilin-type N-terminal cleavage/methylation domain-containing protein
MTKSKLQAACPQRARPGLTLVELLVVVMIMAIMLAVAVPIVRPPVEARAVREAARMVNTALASARTRAIQTGRPVGVMFEPLVAGGKTCAVLHYVQATPPWSGTLEFSTSGDGFSVDSAGTALAFVVSEGSLPISLADDPVDGILKLNYQGYEFDVTELICASGTGSGTFTLKLQNNNSAFIYAKEKDGNPAEYAFQFYLSPRKSSLMPLQLPTRAVVDLGASGLGSSGQFTLATDTPVMVTFAPTGAVDRIYHSGAAAGAKLTSPLYLLVGKPGKTDYTASDKEENNLLDGDNIWIKLDYRTGAVSSAENKPSANVEDARDFIIDG